MKHFFKIFGITLTSLIGILIIAIGVAVWFVFTPERLTPIVRNVADKYITCEHYIGDVELTFFSTFPQFGLKIDEFRLVNPIQGAPTDTVLSTSSIIAKANMRALWKNNAIILDEFELNDVNANIFVDSAGIANYDVFVTDSVQDEDTTSFSIPFNAIQLNKIQLNAQQVSYIDLSTNIDAHLHDLTTVINANLIGNSGNGGLQLNAADVTVNTNDINYLQNGSIQIDAPLYVDLDSMYFQLNQAKLQLNQFAMKIDGSAKLANNGDINTNIALRIDQWQIKPLLALLPKNFADMLGDIDTDGILSLNGNAVGTYNEQTMPLINAQVRIANTQLKYSALPYKFTNIQGDIDAHIDLNDSLASYATIKNLQAQTGRSEVKASGNITQLMADMVCDLGLNLRLNLPEVQPILPSDMNMDVKGFATGTAKAKFKLSQLEKMAFEQMNINGQLNFSNLDIVYDSMFVVSDKAQLTFAIPNKASKRKTTHFLAADLAFDNLDFKQGNNLNASIKKAKLTAETSNLIADERYLSVACDFNIGQVNGGMDNIQGTFLQPAGKAFARLDLQDSTALPILSVDMNMQQLAGNMDTISIDINSPKLKASITGSREDKTQPRLYVNYDCATLKATMGNAIHATTNQFALEVNAKHNANKDNILLQWNPKISVNLQQGKIDMTSFPKPILVNEIVFDYSNKEFIINDSQLQIGNSDFSLKGNIENIGPWLDKAGLLTGELNFVSNVTDVNELMELTSGMGGSAEVVAETPTEKTPTNTNEPEPYMVPKGVDLILHTNIKKALIGKEIATKLGGDLYVKDGVLVLEEMGFICEAAKLQLTAIYKTPRKNHLYVGLDYHMLDINIEELINMIPQIDSMMPMLRSFKGKAEFHIAAETYTDRNYNLKPSTIRGACSIAGKDLVLMDGETFSEIAKILMFNKKTENKVDSISAEFTLFKKEIDIYPFLVTMDKYQAAVGGRHNLDMTFDYHISLLRPLMIGVNVSGNFDDMKIRPSACKYAADFRPAHRKVVETQNAELRKIIRESLQKNVKTE